jgi:flagellar biosynthesis protein FlhG
MHSDLQICVSLPDPTSTMDLYTFLQLSTIRKILGSFLSQSEVAATLKSSSFANLAEATQAGSRQKAQEGLRYFHPLLIINRDRVGGQVNKTKLRMMVSKYLGIDIPELGDIPEDDNVDRALKGFLPVCEMYPSAPASSALMAIADNSTRCWRSLPTGNRRSKPTEPPDAR